MPRAFYIVGPTAVGKSDLAAEVADRLGGEIISADAFQIYRGLPLLTAQPDASTLAKVPHHLVGCVLRTEVMNAARFRREALAAIAQVHERGHAAFVVGGSGMYVQALTHGLSPLPPRDEELREKLSRLSAPELFERLTALDPATAHTIDRHNKHRVLRAVEICILSGRPVSEQRMRAPSQQAPAGVLLLRDRDDLHERIKERVELMFASGVVDEVRAAGRVSATAEKTLGFQSILALLAGALSETECVAQIQQATRRYAKRQLTWFRHQTNFEPLNLTSTGSSEAIEWIAQKARLSFAQNDD